MDYFWNHSFDCSSKFIFSAGYYTGHFGILGTPDGWDYKMGIFVISDFAIFPFVFDRQEKSKRFYVSFCSDSAE